MTREEIHIAKMLDRCRLLPGAWNKRFIRGMASLAITSPGKELTEKQKEWLYRLLYTYRKQLPKTYNRFSTHQYCNKIKSRKIVAK
jgi:hypothetical protein